MKSNILLQGDIGTGKTTALRTLLPEYVDGRGQTKRGAGLRTFLASLEPGAEAALGDNLCQSTDSLGIHLHYIQPLAISWDQFATFMRVLNSLPLDKALSVGDTNKRNCTQLLQLLGDIQNFTCDRCGGEFGDIGDMDETNAVALDGLTNLTTIARHLCVGLKPILSQPEYNPVMGAVEGFLQLFWGGTKCNAILLAHTDREVNPATGMSGITVHTIGQKLAPRIVKMPDEIITTTYEDGKYAWNTELPGQILKVRRMPRGIDLAPDFSQLFK